MQDPSVPAPNVYPPNQIEASPAGDPIGTGAEKPVRNVTRIVIIGFVVLAVGIVGILLVSLLLQNDQPSESACVYNGVSYADGVRFDAIDGCNSCVCENGDVACTEIACDTDDDTPSDNDDEPAGDDDVVKDDSDENDDNDTMQMYEDEYISFQYPAQWQILTDPPSQYDGSLFQSDSEPLCSLWLQDTENPTTVISFGFENSDVSCWSYGKFENTGTREINTVTPAVSTSVSKWNPIDESWNGVYIENPLGTIPVILVYEESNRENARMDFDEMYATMERM